MDPGVCREHLTELFREESALLVELEQLLICEARILDGSDIQQIEQTTRARQERMGALARLEEQRRSLCALHGFACDRAGLEAVMAWCDPSGTLTAALRECAARAIRCRELNDHNGVLVTARLHQVESLLGTLTGRPTRPDTYGPRGYGAASLRSGRVLGAA
ncbi:MAG: flagella synthesis protein FlgN [Steroidobacteraceae bacterium]